MEFTSLNEAAKFYHVSRQSIFLAVKKGRLTAEKRLINGKDQWIIRGESYDEYRKTKYIRENRIHEGKKIYDLEAGRWSVLHTAKYLRIPMHHIYYLLHRGVLRAEKYANSWVIPVSSVRELEQKMKEEKTAS